MNEVIHPGIKVYFFDLDGCIYHGNELAFGVKSLLNELDKNHIQYSFITKAGKRYLKPVQSLPPFKPLQVTVRSIYDLYKMISKTQKKQKGHFKGGDC